jgi:peptide/nickel transport system permease protein
LHRVLRDALSVAAAAWLIVLVFCALLLPLLYDRSYTAIDTNALLLPPSIDHPLGTDPSGRDVLARLLYGARVSLLVGTVAAAIALFLGTAVGATAGYLGAVVDSVLMRSTDTFLAVPVFFFLLLLVSLFGSSLPLLVIGIGAVSWMPVARIIRGEILRHREMDFVLAARTVGATRRRILFQHLLPQAVPALIVAATLGLSYAILTETSLSYLGLGVQPPLPSWGSLLSGAEILMYSAPQLAVYPGLLIILTVLSANVLGDSLSDALDPYSN